MSNATGTYFGTLLRQWREVRRLSQLELSLEAHLSTRHVSCVETGRANPGREERVHAASLSTFVCQ
jgi:transcriptional regulator with XRE-family HTH domain